ncbi:MAG: RsmB/NOP family class I SAM-dependent RNA methyltransferase [Fervidicoccaceae archaeon]
MTDLCERFESDLGSSKTLKNTLESVSSAYGISTKRLLCSLFQPMRKYFLRINRLKLSTDEAIEVLKLEGIQARKSGLLDEAIYIEVLPGDPIQPSEKIAVAEREAAERVMLGADLYLPGLKKLINARKGDEVTVTDENGIPVAKGILLIEPNEVNRRSRGIAVKVVSSLYKMPKVRELDSYSRGIITDQSYPSMLLIRMLDPPAGKIFVDMTASPGGKIGHLYEITGGKGIYYAFDHTQNKILRLKKELSRIGASSVIALKGDSRFISLDHPQIRADITILDPPCTGLGNRPRLSIQFNEKDLRNLVSLQRQLLKEAARITVPGGLISYSTCTLSYEENEGQVEWALNNLPLEPVYPNFPFPQSKLTDHPVARFVPGFHDTIGFFAAIFRRK